MLNRKTTWALVVGSAALAIALIFVSAAKLYAQTPTSCNTAPIPVCQMGTVAGDVQIKPQAVPTSLTKVAYSDAYLKGMTIYQPIGVTVIVQDNQGSPIPIVPAYSPTQAMTTLFLFSAAASPGSPMAGYRYWAPGGFSIIASGAGAFFQASWSQ
jgi:hypothetical protein